MDKKKKWTVKDVITTVLLSAVLIVIQLVVNMVCMANDFVSMVLSVGITMFLCAPLLLKKLSDRKPADCVVTTDVGQHQMWAAQHIAHTRPENFITSSGLGTMGFGLPAAVGAQVARPNDTVVCISGDGSFMMNVQELGTVKRKQLPLKIVLLDNQRLGMVRQWQQLFFQERYSETTLTDNPDFLMLASAFGIPGQHITRKDQVEAALDTMLNSDGPYLLHVSIDELENVWPLVPPGASNSEMLEKLS